MFTLIIRCDWAFFGFVGAMVMNAAFYTLPYDVLNDFVAISPLVKFSIVLFGGRTIPAQNLNLNQLIAWLKANPIKHQPESRPLVSVCLTCFFRMKLGHNSPSCPIVALLP
jgi:hypothetical protein